MHTAPTADGVFRDEQIERTFNRDGFVIVRLLSADAAGSLLAELIAERASAPVSSGQGLDQSFFNKDVAYRKRVDRLATAAIGPALDAVLADYRLSACGLVTKRAGGFPLNLHRDDAILRNRDQVVINTWCALGAVDAANGALAMLRGSHRLPNLEVRGTARFYEDYADTLKDWTEVVELGAGEAILFDNRLLHWSTPNSTNEARHALRAVSVPRDERLVFFKNDVESGGVRFEVLATEGDSAVDLTVGQVMRGEAVVPSLGYVPNTNRPVSLAECAEILGRTLPPPAAERAPRRTLAGKLRDLIGRAT